MYLSIAKSESLTSVKLEYLKNSLVLLNLFTVRIMQDQI